MLPWREILRDVHEQGASLTTLALATHRLGHLRATGAVRGPVARLLHASGILVFHKGFGSCHLGPRATIGRRLRIPHGMIGIVVHDHATIGDDCTLLHHVTLGVADARGGDEAAPTLEDGVTVGAGAAVIGGVVVGRGAVVGAGAVVIRDVAPGATVAGVPARVVG